MTEIVKMSGEHLAAAAELDGECFSCPWSEQSLREELKNPLALWLVALEDGAFAGYVGSQTVMDESDMMNLAVEPHQRRRGIAEALVRRLEQELAKIGSRVLTLEVRQSNESARCLYEKLGYHQIGRRPHYYQRPKEDALIYRKELDR